jgi:hypothetical protein
MRRIVARLVALMLGVLLSVSLTGAAFAKTPAGKSAANIIMQYSYHHGTWARNATSVYTVHGWKTTKSEGFIAITKSGAFIHLVKHEKILFALVDYGTYKTMLRGYFHWNDNSVTQYLFPRQMVGYIQYNKYHVPITSFYLLIHKPGLPFPPGKGTPGDCNPKAVGPCK